MRYCTRCGSKLALITEASGRFDPYNGGAMERRWWVCPQWRPRWWWGNGHSWQYAGEAMIGGAMDPGKTENPPAPPHVVPICGSSDD